MADGDRALVRNAADPKQVRSADRRVNQREDRRLAVTRATMATAEGREYLAGLLERSGIYATVYDHSGSTMYFKEGKRSFGLELLAELTEADESLYELLERERRARARREDARTEAAHTPPAEQGSTR